MHRTLVLALVSLLALGCPPAQAPVAPPVAPPVASPGPVAAPSPAPAPTARAQPLVRYYALPG